MPGVDLHIHSSFSDDGDFTVSELFDFAGKTGLSAIAITDHDSAESVFAAEKAAKTQGIEYIPGIELTSMLPANSSQQHILGYFIDPHSEILEDVCLKIYDCRVEFAKERLQALSHCGLAVSEELLSEKAGKLAPTATAVILSVLENPENAENPAIAEYIRGSKKDNRVALFYREYFSQGAPAYVPFRSIPTQQAVDAIKSAGGVPVLAHPGFTKADPFLDVIAEMGIAGIEALSSYHSDEEVEKYRSYAESRALIATAGSDFHGPTAKPHVRIGQKQGDCFMVQQLREWKERAVQE